MVAGLVAGQRFELIEGDLIDKERQNPPHAFSISAFNAWLTSKFVGRVRIQLPIVVAAPDKATSWPEPYVAVIAGESASLFRSRHPRGDELLLVIEVADSTARHDLTTKRDIYARAGVPEYWVLDLASRKLIVHRKLWSQGQYTEILSLDETEAASLSGQADATLTIARLLP